MLLFIKKNYQDMILSGQKTIEIKAGSRFRTIKPGQRQCINGRIFIVAQKVVEFSSKGALFNWAESRLQKIGSTSFVNFKKVIGEIYPKHEGPFFAIYLNPRSISVRSPNP